LEFKTFAKTGAEAGVEVKPFGVVVESESKNSDSDHLYQGAWYIFQYKRQQTVKSKQSFYFLSQSRDR